MPTRDLTSLREQVAAAKFELAGIEAQFSAIVERTVAADSEEERRECARAAARVLGDRADAERRLSEAKRALAKEEGDKYHHS